MADAPPSSITIAGFRFTEREWVGMSPAERAELLEALRPVMAIATPPRQARRAA
jgi:hypothetical protein